MFWIPQSLRKLAFIAPLVQGSSILDGAQQGGVSSSQYALSVRKRRTTMHTIIWNKDNRSCGSPKLLQICHRNVNIRFSPKGSNFPIHGIGKITLFGGPVQVMHQMQSTFLMKVAGRKLYQLFTADATFTYVLGLNNHKSFNQKCPYYYWISTAKVLQSLDLLFL